MNYKKDVIYMATMLAGLEYIIIDEIQNKINDAQILDVQRGKVFFSSKLSLEVVMMLRSIDNLFI